MFLARALFVTLALGVLAAPFAAHAQQMAKVRRIGLLGTTSLSAGADLVEAFRQGLREHGWVEGQNIVIEYRWAEGKLDRLRDLAAELVNLRVDMIVAPDRAAAWAAKIATNTIPIVVSSGDDPVRGGLVASFARPGGNITGLYLPYLELTPKRLEVLKEAIPGITRVAWLFDFASLGPALTLYGMENSARSLGIELQRLEVRQSDEFESAFRAAGRGRAEALITLKNPLIVTHKARIVNLAAKSRLPAMYDDKEFVEAGGLMSYGPNLADVYRRTATFVDKILKGAKPADLPVEQPTRFELVINMKTAKALGLTIPQSVLFRADRIIE